MLNGNSAHCYMSLMGMTYTIRERSCHNLWLQTKHIPFFLNHLSYILNFFLIPRKLLSINPSNRQRGASDIFSLILYPPPSVTGIRDPMKRCRRRHASSAALRIATTISMSLFRGAASSTLFQIKPFTIHQPGGLVVEEMLTTTIWAGSWLIHRRQIRAARGSSCVESKTAESTKAGLLDGPAGLKQESVSVLTSLD